MSHPAIPLTLGALAMGLVAASPVRGQTVHRLPATPATVAYGYYWAAAKPVLRIASGDFVDVETLLTSTPARLEANGVPSAEIEGSLRAVVDSVTDKGPGGHILTGPIYIEGALPGDVLEVRIESVDLAIPYAYNGCSGFLKEACGEPNTRIIRLDRRRMTAALDNGIVVPLRPFFGSMGVAPPPDSGRVSSNPPGIHAGNLDNKELVAGTILYIPVHVAGALFEVGDGHAAQGDGEVNQTGIETSLRGRLQFIVRKDLKLTWPRVETLTDIITMGTDVDLTVATKIALRQMIEFLMTAKSLPSVEAYRLASIAGDLRITQLVDGRVGVHMMMAKAVLNLEGQLPAWLMGVWSREWIERLGARTSTFTVRYLQTPSWFGDVRFPIDRPKFTGAASLADLTDAQLRRLAKQRGFVGRTTADGLTATWHHEVDFQPNDGGADVGRVELAGPGRMYEHALDSSYTEHWWSLSGGDGRFLTVRVDRAGRLDQLLVVAGDHFYYARNRAKDLPAAASLEALIASTKATRAQIIGYLDCELSVGRIRGGAVPWEIQYSTLPWREGRHLEFVDRIGGAGSISGLNPRTEPGETWSVPVNTVAPSDLLLLFPPIR